MSGTLTGTLGAGEAAQISVDDGVSWTDLVVSDGAWSYDDGRTLADGDHDYLVRVVDQGGNVGATGSRTVTVDTAAPADATAIAITAVSDDSGHSSGDFITSDTSLTVSGTLTGTLGAGEAAQISIDDGASWTDLVVSDGAWSYDDGRTLADGDHDYLVRVVDQGGNVGATGSRTVTVDTAAPADATAIAIAAVSDDSGHSSGDFITSDTSLTVSGTLTGTLGAGETAQISIDDGVSWTDLVVSDGAIGGVVQAGGVLMEIIPLDDQLLIEARLSPRDIAFIHPGQEATVKITAYDYSIYGTLNGRVDRISPDTIEDEIERGNFYYRVYVITDHAYLETKDGKRHPIIPGMIATSEIRTGAKTVLDYLLKPLDRAAEALRER